VSVVCLFLAFKDFRWTDLINALANADWIWLIPAFLLSLLSYIFRSMRWKILLSPIKKIKLKDVFIVLTFGFFVNNILPLRLGELARVYALKKLEDVPLSSGLGSVALERISDFIGLLFVMFLAMPILPHGRIPIQQVIVLMIIGIALVLGLSIFFERKGKHLQKIPGIFGKIFGFLNNITRGFSALKSPQKIILTVLAATLIWTTDICTMAVVSKVFGLNLSLLQAAAVIVGIAFGVMIPAAPGYVGTYEFFAKETLVFLGFPAAPALSFILVIHFFQVLVTILFAFPGMLKVGLSGIKFKLENKLDSE